MLRNFANSAVVTVLATVLSVLVNSLAGYAFAKLPFRRPRTAVSNAWPARWWCRPRWACCRFSCCCGNGAGEHLRGGLVPYLASIFGIFLIRQYALSVPDELLDAARIDGAGEFTDLPHGRPAHHQAHPGDHGGLHLPERVERFHVAA